VILLDEIEKAHLTFTIFCSMVIWRTANPDGLGKYRGFPEHDFDHDLEPRGAASPEALHDGIPVRCGRRVGQEP